MSKIIVLSIFAGLVALVATDLPVDVSEVYTRNTGDEVDATIYRVPEDLDALHFEIEITPYFDVAPAGKETFTFDGKVTIKLKAIKENVSSLIIQENVRRIGAITLTDTAGVPIRINNANAFERIQQYHFLMLNLADGVTLEKEKEYLLTIEYVGNINETPLQRGMFRGNYKDKEGKIHWYAATHLQPVNSRQLFPSLDEPGFKSTFDIIVNRPIDFTETFSNMPLKSSVLVGDRVREVFHTTPKMSAYLVTIHISDGFTIIADNKDSEKSYRILARPDAAGQGDYALEIGPNVTEWLDQYLGIEYYSMAEHIKNDQIASAYWASGATENWGLVTYRELRLLYQEGETNAVDKMSIGTITAHELAHKWFGNLITCRWWDNVWINEGFASYFEYFAMDGVDESMELADQFNIMYVQSALASDSSTGTRSLQHTVNSPAQVTGHFSGISYSKGAALLQMLKHYVGDATFKKALFKFLDNKKYDHAYPEDLYEAFAEAVEEDEVAIASGIAEMMKDWVEEPGYPVLDVEVNMGTGAISLKQKRFYISPSAPASEQLWVLPLTYTTGRTANWEPTVTKVMKEETDTASVDPGHDWVIFNVQQRGIYRVNYDTHNWEMLASALSSNVSAIHFLNRAQIVDDVFALTRAEQMPYDLGFQVIDFLKQDTSYYSWYPAIIGFNWLRNRFLHLPEELAQFDEILYEYLNAVIKDLGYDVEEDEPLTRTLNRFYVLSFACNIGHAGCVNDAVEKFKALNSDSATPVNPNLRRHVFCEGLRDGGYEEWKFLFDRRQASNNQADEVVMLRALGCTTNEQARKEYLEMILNDDIVKAQDRLNAFSFLLMGDRSNAPVVLNFLKENADEIRKGVVLQSWFDSVVSNVAAYLDADGLDEMEAWLKENQNQFPEYSVGISSIASARANQAWGTTNAHIVLKAAAAKGSAAIVLPTAMMMFTALLALLLK